MSLIRYIAEGLCPINPNPSSTIRHPPLIPPTHTQPHCYSCTHTQAYWWNAPYGWYTCTSSFLSSAARSKTATDQSIGIPRKEERIPLFRTSNSQTLLVFQGATCVFSTSKHIWRFNRFFFRLFLWFPELGGRPVESVTT